MIEEFCLRTALHRPSYVTTTANSGRLHNEYRCYLKTIRRTIRDHIEKRRKMQSRAERIKVLLDQKAAIDEELDQIKAQITAEREALKPLRKPRSSRKMRQPELALVGETQ